MEDLISLAQVDEILNHLKHEDLIKIPYEIRKAIKDKKDNKYNWNYDESKPLNEQNINRKTIAILSYLNMEYLLNEEQKKLMEKIHKFNEDKAEQAKRNKYNPNKIFAKDKLDEEINEVNYENKVKVNEVDSNNKMIIITEDKWYKKIIKAIVNIFSKKIG